ncbi:MAG: acetate--CoA ligase [Candidatus Omnitrophica bacterium]|nr:acetate--CoA ligase [Candidatus Omnitrophota bacterium]MDE2009652.1 acetate--CoA ligase [Candidatus Omnitrophota bacterium]MDE2214420.1 acetate--CoA ligase [Candidatus Omnitrophota bacterium]MDE2231560.1 acetate--CoA ligase [Candidatus Omnitrophota bacterium]
MDQFKPEVDDLYHETRVIHPSALFQNLANIKDASLYAKAKADRTAFWEECARKLDWFSPWKQGLVWEKPFAKWFVGGKLNASYNCLDRHIKANLGNKTAFIWEGENGEEKTLTYAQCYLEVNKLANAIKSLGIARGDRVAIYMPMIPEAVLSMLACSRIGAVHTVIFGGFSALALQERINDAQAKLLITADGGYRRGKLVPLKTIADTALAQTPSIHDVIVVRRADGNVPMKQGRDHWYHDVMRHAKTYCEPEEMDSEDILYILYTSGTTGKPKGIVHSTGGYLTGVAITTHWVFDLKPNDVFWCTADIGWVTGHSYIVYGPMANAATQVLYEGAPDFPQRDRFWRIIEKHKVSVFYTAPTAIRAFMKWGPQWPKKCHLGSLRLLGSVGEPINPEAWIWYHEHIGNYRCPIVDTWWQTETGAIMITTLPGVTPMKPGSAGKPLPGIDAEILNEEGQTIAQGGGFLGLTSPWPSMLRGIWGDQQRYKDTYWQRWSGKYYFAGDGTKRDKDGYFWFLGRVDDIMLVAGHNISTAEVESALVDNQMVAEAAVVGVKDEIKGQAIAAFVILKEGHPLDDQTQEILKDHVAQKIGAIARPSRIIFTSDVPKTRSGKIMRRLLRDIAEGRVLGDVTTLADPNVIAALKEKYQEA